MDMDVGCVGAFSAASRGGSPALRGCLAAGLVARRRDTARAAAALQAALLAVLLVDLWSACPGYTSTLHAVELCLAALLAVSLLWHVVQLAPPRTRMPATANQLKLLGVHRSNLESSFQLLDSSGSSHSSTAGSPRGSSLCGHSQVPQTSGLEDVSALSLSRSWGSAGGGAGEREGGAGGSPRSAAAAVEPPPQDRFIADTDSLADYLRRYEAARAVESAALAGAAPRGGWGGNTPVLSPAPRTYQLASPPPESPDGADEPGVTGVGGVGGAGGASARAVWRRLNVDPQQLTQYNLNLRVWLHVTILARLVREMASVDEALANHHLPDVRLGEVPVERLRKTAASPLAAQHAPGLRPLLAYLEPFAHQRYTVQRIKELARGGALSGYRWDGGGADWDDSKPTDAEIVFHLFVTYMDATTGATGEEAAFSSRHVCSMAGGLRPRPPATGAGPAIACASTRPPHYVLLLAGDALSLRHGRTNLLHTLLLLLAALRHSPRAPLGPHALNLLWVIGVHPTTIHTHGLL